VAGAGALGQRRRRGRRPSPRAGPRPPL